MPQRRDDRADLIAHPSCSGDAIVEAVIDVEGKVRLARPMRPRGFCGEEAVNEVKRWLWQPIEWDGEPVELPEEGCSWLPGDAVAAEIAVTVRFAPVASTVKPQPGPAS